MNEIEKHLYDAADSLDPARSLAHSTLAIAQMMHAYMNAPIVTAELVAEPCQCQRDELAEAAPELLRLAREVFADLVENDGATCCPWCGEWKGQHESHCPAAAILRKFEGR